jgi:hypothetical protein
LADKDNEGKALDAVLRFIEARDNALRKDDGWSPDDPKDPDPDPLRRVDYVCRLLYAFEHTRIEPFPNHATKWNILWPQEIVPGGGDHLVVDVLSGKRTGNLAKMCASSRIIVSNSVSQSISYATIPWKIKQGI